MAMEERTEQATPKRRSEARKKGQVARSPELTGAMIFLALALVVPSLSITLWSSMSETIKVGLASASDTTITPNHVLRHLASALVPILKGWAPLILLCIFISVIMNVLQVGLLWTWKPVVPDFKRINPMSGFQRIFSSRAAVDLLKAMIKMSMIAWVAWKTLNAEYPSIVQTGLMDPVLGFSVVGKIIFTIAWRVGLLWLILAGFDVFYQRWNNERSMRMTKEEVRREYKEADMSQHIRGKIRQKQRQAAQKRMMQDVRKADVIVTNPVTYAVAIRYDVITMKAPRVLAKGKLKIAERIKEEAKKFNIPIVPNPPLARELYASVEIGDEIPQTLYQAVAQLLAYVYSLRNRNKKAA